MAQPDQYIGNRPEFCLQKLQTVLYPSSATDVIQILM